jgi:hypothetical protein
MSDMTAAMREIIERETQHVTRRPQDSEGKHQARMIKIPLQKIHVCEPDYCDDQEAKCTKSGEIESTSIHIASFDPSEPGFVEADEVVIPGGEIRIEFDYLLGNPTAFRFKLTRGFTRGRLVGFIVSAYKRIYATEEKTIRDRPVLQRGQPGWNLNRNTTDGKYAIWGIASEICISRAFSSTPSHGV